MSEHCGNCRFFLAQPSNGQALTTGLCRRNPPSMITVPVRHPISGQTEIQLQGRFSPVHENNWCGEWQLGVKIEVGVTL